MSATTERAWITVGRQELQHLRPSKRAASRSDFHFERTQILIISHFGLDAFPQLHPHLAPKLTLPLLRLGLDVELLL